MNSKKMFGEKIEKNIRYNPELDVYYVQFNFSPTNTSHLRSFPTLEDARTYRDTINAEKLNFKINQDRAVIRNHETKEIKELVPYPYNVFKCTSLKDKDISGFFIDNFNVVLAEALTEKEAIFVKRFFANGLTLQEIGKENLISRERVRQVIAVAVRKLTYYILHYEEIKQVKDTQENLPINSHPIEMLDFSTRIYNCLRRKHIRTIGDLASTLENDFINTRGLGKKSLKEIRDKLYSLGLDFASLSE